MHDYQAHDTAIIDKGAVIAKTPKSGIGPYLQRSHHWTKLFPSKMLYWK